MEYYHELINAVNQIEHYRTLIKTADVEDRDELDFLLYMMEEKTKRIKRILNIVNEDIQKNDEERIYLEKKRYLKK